MRKLSIRICLTAFLAAVPLAAAAQETDYVVSAPGWGAAQALPSAPPAARSSSVTTARAWRWFDRARLTLRRA
jgi:hypothetical protein